MVECLGFWLVDLKLRNNAVAYGHFFGEIVTERKKAPNLAPFYVRMKARLKVKAKLFVLYFAIENKKYTEKRLSEYLYYSSRYFRCWKLLHLDHGGIFYCILNTSHNLLKNTRKRVWKNQPERREVHVRDERWQVKPSFHQSEKCFCKLLPTRKSYFLFWLKK